MEVIAALHSQLEQASAELEEANLELLSLENETKLLSEKNVLKSKEIQETSQAVLYFKQVLESEINSLNMGKVENLKFDLEIENLDSKLLQLSQYLESTSSLIIASTFKEIVDSAYKSNLVDGGEANKIDIYNTLIKNERLNFKQRLNQIKSIVINETESIEMEINNELKRIEDTRLQLNKVHSDHSHKRDIHQQVSSNTSNNSNDKRNKIKHNPDIESSQYVKDYTTSYPPNPYNQNPVFVHTITKTVITEVSESIMRYVCFITNILTHTGILLSTYLSISIYI